MWFVDYIFWPVFLKDLSERKENRWSSKGWLVYSITALRKDETPINTRRGKEWVEAFPKFLISSPSFHGGRGALPSAGGHPADLTFLAGGGC